jgi:hypothetical protein
MKTTFNKELTELKNELDNTKSINMELWETKIENLRTSINAKKAVFKEILEDLNEEEAQCNILISTMVRKFVEQPEHIKNHS